MIIILLLCVIPIIYHEVKIHKIFKYDINPHRRTCKLCGCIQEEFERSYNTQEVWWEDMYDANKIVDCPCHKFSTYKI